MRLWEVFLIMSIALFGRIFSAQTSDILIAKPKNTVAFKGSRVELECHRTTNDDTTDQHHQLIDWEFTQFGDTAPIQFYFNGKFHFKFDSKYEILRNEKGRFNLVINSVDFSYAGQYSCLPRSSEDTDNQRASADLVVLDSDPYCKASPEKEEETYFVYKIHCSINYAGNVRPSMECSSDDGSVSNNTDVIISALAPNNITSANVTSYFNVTGFNDVVIKCNITFKATVRPNGPVNNFDYVYTWGDTLPGARETSEGNLDDSSPPFVIIGVVFGLSLLAVCLLAMLIHRLRNLKLKGRRSREPDILILPYQESTDFHIYEDVRLENSTEQHSGNTVLEESTNERPNSRQNGHAPIYAEVRKEKKANAGQLTKPSANEKPNSQCNIGALEPEVIRTYKTTTGADGTVYVEVNPHSDQRRFTPLPFNHQPRFNKVENYAFIDHTRKPLPPSPPPSPSF